MGRAPQQEEIWKKRKTTEREKGKWRRKFIFCASSHPTPNKIQEILESFACYINYIMWRKEYNGKSKLINLLGILQLQLLPKIQCAHFGVTKDYICRMHFHFKCNNKHLQIFKPGIWLGAGLSLPARSGINIL